MPFPSHTHFCFGLWIWTMDHNFQKCERTKILWHLKNQHINYSMDYSTDTIHNLIGQRTFGKSFCHKYLLALGTISLSIAFCLMFPLSFYTCYQLMLLHYFFCQGCWRWPHIRWNVGHKQRPALVAVDPVASRSRVPWSSDLHLKLAETDLLHQSAESCYLCQRKYGQLHNWVTQWTLSAPFSMCRQSDYSPGFLGQPVSEFRWTAPAH